ncbi:SDR family NAD(P)-dependent oxidoreductase [Nocardia sp. BMG51109]|uniref:SDR family NAD(P)-dependent oxidoreductase n=1 Tax=Nocardia sp. BMG51109 TaxID=1056816 RepID=UPI0004B7B291|nr:SDR family NAD(P)-dependent oxidoreductase [Nocardia sp. BMG51109]
MNGRPSTRERGGVLFLFSGQGGEYAGMGRALAARYPAFARAVDAAAEAVVRAGGPRVWTPRHGFANSLAAADAIQPALFSYQFALAELLREWRIRLDAVAGYGVGEVAGAVVSGALPLADGARVAVARGRVPQDGPGAAAVLEGDPDELRRMVEPMRAAVAIASVDGPRSVVVSGEPRYVETLLRRAHRRGLPARTLAVDPTLHRPSARDLVPDFVTRLDGLAVGRPRLPIYSTVRRAQVLETAALTAEYWTENVCGTVELAAALETAAADGLSTVVEVAPSPVLAAAVRGYDEFRESTYTVADRDDEAETFLEAVARLHAEGRTAPPVTEAGPPFGNEAGEHRPTAVADPSPAATTGAATGYEWLTAAGPASSRRSGAPRRPGIPDATDGTGRAVDGDVTDPTGDMAENTRGTAVYGPTVATAAGWAASIVTEEHWVPEPFPDHHAAPHRPPLERALVVGESTLAVALERELDRRLSALRVTCDPADAGPIVSSLTTGHTAPTAIVLVWPTPDRPVPVTTGIAGALDLLQRVQDGPATTLTVVLTDRDSLTQNAIAGLVRTLQLESALPTRLIWASDDDPAPVADQVLNPTVSQEIRISDHTVRGRRFRSVAAGSAPIGIRAEGTYVVTGGLGTLGAVAVRWLLEAGARDVVVLTRAPRPLPRLLDGLDDRIVVVRCDVTDRADLANALFDIRACGSTVRGVVHAAGVRRDAEFGSVTTGVLADLYEPRVGAAGHLLDLTAPDPVDFVLLSSSSTGALGAPGQAADAAVHAALDTLARSRIDDRIRSIGWGVWISGPVVSAGDARLRRAGMVPFDVARGTAVLSVALGHRSPSVLAVDYAPTDDAGPIAARLRGLLPEGAGPPQPAPKPLGVKPVPLHGHSTAAALGAALTRGIRPTPPRDEAL